MHNDLYLEIIDICKNRGVNFRWRHDHVSNIFHCIFTIENKSVNYSINEYILAYQPKWITMREIEERINILLN